MVIGIVARVLRQIPRGFAPSGYAIRPVRYTRLFRYGRRLLTAIGALLDIRLRQTAITLCGNGRLFGPNTSPGAFARRDRADAGGAPAVPGDRISPRPPRELRISRSGRARFLGPQSARDQNGPRLAQRGRFHRSSSPKREPRRRPCRAGVLRPGGFIPGASEWGEPRFGQPRG